VKLLRSRRHKIKKISDINSIVKPKTNLFGTSQPDNFQRQKVVFEHLLQALQPIQVESLSTQETSSDLRERMHKLEDRQNYTESRVDELEFQFNLGKFKDKIEKIEQFATKVFSEIPQIVNLSYEPLENSLRIMIIHEFASITKAIETVQKPFFSLEEAFPAITFESSILHVSDITSRDLKHVKTIFQR